MNTFQPFTDDDDQQEYQPGIHQNHNQLNEENQRDFEINQNLLPPDDESLNNLNLMDNSNQNSNMYGQNAKPKSRGRYEEQQQETGTFKNQRKQWGSRASASRDEFSVNNSNDPHHIQKPRQILEDQDNYMEADPNMIPDVSIIENEDFSVPANQRVDYSQYDLESSRVDEEFNNLQDWHQEVFQKLIDSKLFEKLSPDIIKYVESKISNTFEKYKAYYKDPNTKEKFTPDVIKSEILESIQQLVNIVSDHDQKQKENQALERNLNFEEESQNMHPNIYNEAPNVSREEFKLNESGVHPPVSPINPAKESNPVTPEQVPRRSHTQRQPERTKQSVIQSQMSMNPNSMQLIGDEKDEEIRRAEGQLNMNQRLAHKTWQIRRNAYKELAFMFEQFSNGQKFYEAEPEGNEYEFNPLDRHQDWLLRCIRDTNLIAQEEGLNTLHMFMNKVPDAKNALKSTLPDLLDKINHSHKKFKNITISIIDLCFERGLCHEIVPELLKRIKNARNDKITTF